MNIKKLNEKYLSVHSQNNDIDSGKVCYRLCKNKIKFEFYIKHKGYFCDGWDIKNLSKYPASQSNKEYQNGK
jgi:hypothetical protein